MAYPELSFTAERCITLIDRCRVGLCCHNTDKLVERYSHTQTFFFAGGASAIISPSSSCTLYSRKSDTSFIRFWLMDCKERHVHLSHKTVPWQREPCLNAYHQNKSKDADWTPHLFGMAHFRIIRKKGGGVYRAPLHLSPFLFPWIVVSSTCHRCPQKVACETLAWIDAYVCFFQLSRTIKVVVR